MPSKITYEEGITVGELADKLNIENQELLKLFLLASLLILTKHLMKKH